MADNLYCPRCSNEFSDGTGYCRNCGLSLDAVSKIVTGEAASAPEIQTRPNFKLMRLGIGLFILGLVIGLINGALREFGLYPDSYGKTLFLVIVAAGMLMLGAGFIFPKKTYKKRKVSAADHSAPSKSFTTAPLAGELNAASVDADPIQFPKNKLSPENQPVGSVTESTTRQLRQVDQTISPTRS